MAITIKTEKEIEILREGGKILAEVLKELEKLVRLGVSTGFLNKRAEEMISARGAKPSFKGYKPSFADKSYPAAVCASLNEVVVHGLPSEKLVLKEGDILKLDLGIEYNKLFTDSAVTIGIGKISEEKQKLIDATKKALELAIEEIGPGKHLGDIGYAVESCATKAGFSIVKVLVGHGVGYAVHEEPNIPNYGRKGEGLILKSGMVLAIEPMMTMGSDEVRQTADGFGYETVDGSFSAHFEHTVVVTESGYDILTK